MSQTTPPPTEPAKATVEAITPPPTQRVSFWAMAVAVVAGLPVLIDMLLTTPGLDLPPNVRAVMAIVSVIGTWVSVMQNGDRGVKAAARVKEQTEAQIDAKSLR